MVELGRAAGRAGLTVWVAGGPAGRTEEARAAGAALNVWDAEPALVAERAAGPDGVEVTWAGPPPSAVAAARRAAAGAARGRRHAGPCSAGRSTSRSWPPRRAPLGDGRRVRRARTRVVDFPDGVPPHQRAAALRLRHHQRPEGGRRGEPGATSSTSASGTPTCPRPTWRWTSWPRPPTTRATTATRPRAASRSCAAPSPTSTSASSASSSTPRPRWSPPSGPRRASRT